MRTAGSNSAGTRKAIRSASLELIFRHGFEAASLRALAKKVGIQVGSLYNYFESKEELLVYIIKNSLEERLEKLEPILDGIDDPVEALRAFVKFNVKFLTQRKQEAVVANRDLLLLSPKNLKEVVALRDRYDGLLTGIIEAGVKKGVFTVADVRVATFAIIGMFSGIAGWYRPSGRLSPTQLEDTYADYALSILGAGPASQGQPIKRREAAEPA